MDDEDMVRKDLYGARCTLGHWEKRMASLVTRALLHGNRADAEERRLIEYHIGYWQGEIKRMEKWLAERPPGWGSW